MLYIGSQSAYIKILEMVGRYSSVVEPNMLGMHGALDSVAGTSIKKKILALLLICYATWDKMLHFASGSFSRDKLFTAKDFYEDPTKWFMT